MWKQLFIYNLTSLFYAIVGYYAHSSSACLFNFGVFPIGIDLFVFDSCIIFYHIDLFSQSSIDEQLDYFQIFSVYK